MDYLVKLKDFGKKTITKEELEQLYRTTSDEMLFAIVKQLKLEGILQPVRTSKTNGNNRYPIYLKYRILLPEEDYSVELAEISSLHPLLQARGYLQEKPEQYRKYRTLLRKLDAYLFQGTVGRIPVSRKERSFEIFDEEKVLEDRSFCTVLEHLGMNGETLDYYDTPEYYFNDYIPARKPEMTLLICENKDIWFNIRRIMFEDQRFELFGTRFDGVVYGCGNKVSQKDALSTYTRFMGGANVTDMTVYPTARAPTDTHAIIASPITRLSGLVLSISTAAITVTGKTTHESNAPNAAESAAAPKAT